MGIGALLVLSGCGGKVAPIPVDEPDGVAGMPGEGADSKPSKPDSKPSKPDDVPVVLDDNPDVAAETERIAGTSFDLLPEPFDEDLRRGRCGGYAKEVQPFLSAATYHFRKDESGGLELLLSLPQPWLRIETSKLQRTKIGWRTATPLATGACMGWGSEEEQEVGLSAPKSLDLVFSGTDPNGEPTAVAVTAHFAATDDFEATTLTSTGARDTTAPRLQQLPAYMGLTAGGDYRVTVGNLGKAASYVGDDWFAWDLPRSFVFSEALAPGWSAALEDADGNVVALAKGEGGMELGFDVAAYYPAGYRWILQGQDLAGNPMEVGGNYVVQELAPSDGTFEAATPVAVYLDGIDSGTEGWFTETPACLADELFQSICTGETAPGRPEVTALAGSRSLWLPTGAFFRISRKPNAAQVSFNARNLGGEVRYGWVGVMSLDAGSAAGLQYTRVEGQLLEGADAANGVRRFSLPVPAGTGDVLVAIQAAHDGEEDEPLWLDSLRTE